MTLELDLTEKMRDRVQLAAEAEGLTQGAFLERAVFDAVLASEKRNRTDPVYYDAAKYPYLCEFCPRRFKLAMHRARHVKWVHQELLDQPEPPTMIPVESDVPTTTITLAPDTPQAEVIHVHKAKMTTIETSEPKSKLVPEQRQFTLSAAITPELMELFEGRTESEPELESVPEPEPEPEPLPPLHRMQPAPEPEPGPYPLSDVPRFD